MNTTRSHSLFILWLFALSVLVSCQGLMSHHTEGELSHVIQALEGKDPLLLSEANPYLAPNVLVSLLKQESDTIRGFLSDRGTPDGVRVISGTKDESKVEFFYLSPDELYRIEEKEKIWVILGPEAIQREYILPLRHGVRKRLKSEEVSDQREDGRGSNQNIERQDNAYAPEDISRTSVGNKASSLPTEDSELDEENAILRAQVLELVRQSDGDTANRDSKGDLLHQVTSTKESFVVLSLWYTLSKENGAPIARINGKSPAARPQEGDVVRIPSYLIRNDKSLSSENTERMLEILQVTPD